MPNSIQTVLIIDDDATTIRLLAEALSSLYEIVISTTAEDGIKQAQISNPDLILLDIVMPDMDGFEVCRRLKTDPQTQPIPVIFISALDEPSKQMTGFALGAVDYVAKPINIPILRARVKTHVRFYLQSKLLATLATTDSLTRLANRRKFDETIDLELKRAQREQSSLGLLIVDIDDFKAYNDHYGHGKGDDCLILVAKLLSRCVSRGSDLVSRLGGEEFAIILPDTDAQGVQNIAARIIEKCTDEAIEHVHSRTQNYLTVSIGATVIVPKDGEGLARSMLECADRALYEAKNQGRNRMVFKHYAD